MSAPGQDRVDVDVLAADGARLTRRYALRRFARLADTLAASEGEAVARFSFVRLDEGLPGCELELSAEATLRCQRCLGTFRQPLRSVTKLAFVADAGSSPAPPEEFETVEAPQGRVDLAELVEDELLLSLPVVALHGEGTQCAGSARRAEVGEREVPATETHRPFAKLQDLMKH